MTVWADSTYVSCRTVVCSQLDRRQWVGAQQRGHRFDFERPSVPAVHWLKGLMILRGGGISMQQPIDFVIRAATDETAATVGEYAAPVCRLHFVAFGTGFVA